MSSNNLSFEQIGKPFLMAQGFLFTEGPVWNKEEGYILFSDIPASVIYKLTLPNSVEVFRRYSFNSNGLAYDINGLLLAAEHGSRTVTRMQKDGSITAIADNYKGNKLHSPNDIAVRSDGMIYFTDPPFGLGMRPPELDFMGLFRLDVKGDIHLEGEFNQYLNGLAFSPDEKLLYLALTASDEILVLDVAENGTLSNARHFADVLYPDGMAVDVAGNLYITGEDGVEVFRPDGSQVGTIVTDRQPANCAFAGEDGKLLVITARDCVYGVEMPIPGVLVL